MKYCIALLFSILLVSAVSAQSNSDSTLTDSAKRLYGTPIQRNIVRIVGALSLEDGLQYTQNVQPQQHAVYSENTQQLGGLPINAFRFQNINQIANTQAGVFSVDGETPSVLGARTEGTAYYINGVRVLEGFLPQTP